VKASSVTVGVASTFTVSADDYYFEVPKYTTFNCSSQSLLGDEIKYCTVNKVVFVAVSGENSYDADWFLVQGSPYNGGAGETFSGNSKEFQVYELSSDKAIEEYMEVWVDNGDGLELWNYVPNLYQGVDSTSKVYTTRFNPNKKVEIQFGNATFGVKPATANDNIVVKYIESLGQYGQIGANEISGMSSTIFIKNNLGVDTDTQVNFTITQADRSDGGRDPLTEAEISNLAPRYYRTQNRMVTNQDHEDLILAGFNDYVAKVKTLNSDEYFALTGETTGTSGLYYNNLYIYVLPRNSDTITENLRSELDRYIEQYKMSSMQYIYKPINFYDFIPIVSWKKSSTTTKTVSEISHDIESSLRTYFSKLNREFGEEIKYSSVMENLIHVDGIDSLTLALCGETSPVSSYYENIQLTAMQFPRIEPNWDPSTYIVYVSGGN
jgi:hypothetical protein